MVGIKKYMIHFIIFMLCLGVVYFIADLRLTNFIISVLMWQVGYFVVSGVKVLANKNQ